MSNMRGVTVTTIITHVDIRGSLWKLMQAEFNDRFQFGETYLTIAKPGVWRGGHYHEEIREWFIVLQGKALFHLYNLDTNEYMEIEVSEKDRLRLEIAPRVAHAFINQGTKPLLLLAIATKCYDPKNPDTYPDKRTAFDTKDT